MATVDAPAAPSTQTASPRPKSTFPVFAGGLVVGLLVGLFGGAVGLPFLESTFGFGSAPVTTESVKSRRAATPAEQAERQKQLAPAPAEPAPQPDSEKPAPAPTEAPKN